MRIKRLLVGVLALIVALGGGWLGWRWLRSIPVGDVRVDPLAAPRPDKSYQIVVWDTDVPLPWSPTPYSAAVDEAVAAFQQAHPNITIDYHLYDPADLEAALSGALAAGQPPDVLGAPLALYARDWQVPLERYLSEEAREDWTPAAYQAAAGAEGLSRRRPHLWGWPRWIAPTHWIARRDLLETFGLAIGSAGAWDYEQILAVLRAHKAAGRTRTGGLAVDAANPSLFAELMAAAGYPDLLGPQGTLLWTREAMAPVVEFIAHLAEGDLVAAPLPEIARQRLSLLEAGRALAIAPVNAWSTYHLFQTLATPLPAAAGGDAFVGWDPLLASLAADAARLSEEKLVLLLPPAPPEGGGTVAATASGFMVFRQTPYRGHDHVRA
ncbi:MAG TPA: hypothetical protein VF234_10105, partial [Limnochordia bacterium]